MSCELTEFGQTKSCSSNSFSGAGQYYFNARWYDPTLGRFISEDPARSGGNWFAFCNNDPLSKIDPSGLDPTTDPLYRQNPGGWGHTTSYDSGSGLRNVPNKAPTIAPAPSPSPSPKKFEPRDLLSAAAEPGREVSKSGAEIASAGSNLKAAGNQELFGGFEGKDLDATTKSANGRIALGGALEESGAGLGAAGRGLTGLGLVMSAYNIGEGIYESANLTGPEAYVPAVRAAVKEATTYGVSAVVGGSAAIVASNLGAPPIASGGIGLFSGFAAGRVWDFAFENYLWNQ